MTSPSAPTPQIWLASTSPRRRDLLHAAGIPFACVEPGPELDGGGSPVDEARGRAAGKARGARLPPVPARGAIVVGVDTVVDVDGVEFGQPGDAASAERMLRALLGREHLVHTGVHLVGHGGALAGREVATLATARVRFDTLDEGAIRAFVAGGSWRGKAGGYGIQDAAGAFARVVRGHGDLDTVIGLPVAALRRAIDALVAATVDGRAPDPESR